MESAIEKCAMLIMRRKKQQMTEGKELLNEKKIRTLAKKQF